MKIKLLALLLFPAVCWGQITISGPSSSGGISDPSCTLLIAASDESTAITAGGSKVTFRAPYAFTLSSVRASLSVASGTGSVVVDINQSGTSILSTPLSIDVSELTSVTSATAAVISTAAISDDAEISIDIDSAGSGAKGLKISLIGN